MRPSWNLHGGCPAFLGISWWCRKWSPGGTVGKETLEVWHPMAGDRTIHDVKVKRGCIWTRVIHPILLCLSHHNCTHKVPRVPLVRMQLVFIHTRTRSIVWPQKFRHFCCGVRFAAYSERLTRVNNITTQKPRMMAQFLKGGLMRIGSAACRFRSPADVVINSDGYIANVWRNYLNYSKTLKITRHSRFWTDLESVYTYIYIYTHKYMIVS